MQNETRQHFELRDIKGDMERAQQEAYKVISPEDATRNTRNIQLLAAALVGIIILLVWILGGSPTPW